MAPDSILDAVWPRRCEFCGAAPDRPGRHVCSDCLARIPFVRQNACCRVCGREYPGIDPSGGACSECTGANAPHFDAAASAVRFEGAARRMLLDFKYNRHFWMMDDVADWLEGALRARLSPSAVDAVLPVPSSPLHRLDRGYNQCEFFARAVARRIGRKFIADAAIRTGDPLRQAGLDEETRRENAKGTFAVPRPEAIRGRTVLAIDDIITTGSTLSEFARELKKAGAWRVWCLTLAQTVRS